MADEYRPAHLTPEQLQRVRALERELGVVLVAYRREAGEAPRDGAGLRTPAERRSPPPGPKAPR